MPRKKPLPFESLHPRDSRGWFKKKRLGAHHPAAPGRLKVSKGLRNIRVVTETQLREREKETRRQLRKKKFGKPGPKLSKKQRTAKLSRHVSSPRGSKKRKVVTGISTRIRAVGGYAEVKNREIWITLHSQPFSNAVTSGKAADVLPSWEAAIKTLYKGRLTILGFQHTLRKRG